MKAGDAFLIKKGLKDTGHLFVVLSDPEKLPDSIFPDRVFLAMLTTKEKWKEDSCVLKPGDHPFLKHDTVAAFDTPPSLFITLQQLQTLKDQKWLIDKGEVSMDVLRRLREGYANSDYRKDKIYQFLFRQRVID